MTIKLIRTDAIDCAKIQLLQGEHIIGRGKLLDCNDKRISREHGELLVNEESITIKALHQNPCFYTKNGTNEIEILHKGNSITLNSGDRFGLLPETYWYEVISFKELVESEDSETQNCTEEYPVGQVKVEVITNDDDNANGDDNSINDDETLNKDCNPESPSLINNQNDETDKQQENEPVTENVLNEPASSNVTNEPALLNVIKDEPTCDNTDESSTSPSIKRSHSSLDICDNDIGDLKKVKMECDVQVKADPDGAIPGPSDQPGVDDDEEFSDSESSFAEEELEMDSSFRHSTVPLTSQRDCKSRSGVEPKFEWTTESHTPDLPVFNSANSGFNFLLADMNELNVFQYFLDDDFISQIVETTNLFHSNFISNVNLRTHSRLKKWHDMTVPEMYIFLAVMMLMTRNRHLSIEEHWSSDILLQAPIFSKLISRNRFCMILKMLHFSLRSEENKPLSKIEKFVNNSKQKFKSCITPFKNICISESVVPFKGRLWLKHYQPNKRNRFVIKLFLLCDVQTGFIIDFIVYCGAVTDIVDPCDLGVGGAVVTSLLKDFYYSNRHLYVDNRFSSPSLFKYLYEHGIFACGTVNKKSKGLPKLNSKLKLHGMEVQYSAPLMVQKWKEKSYIYILSTIHDSHMESSKKENGKTGPSVKKPRAVLDYSKNMGSIDTVDMLLSSLQCINKTIKWYKKLFFHVIDMHLLNSFYCFKQTKGRANLKFSHFQLSLIRQLIAKYHTANILEKPRSISKSKRENPLRSIPTEAAGHMPSKMGKYQRCKLCSDKKERKHTRYTCKTCNVYLCAAPCFEEYHII